MKSKLIIALASAFFAQASFADTEFFCSSLKGQGFIKIEYKSDARVVLDFSEHKAAKFYQLDRAYIDYVRDSYSSHGVVTIFPDVDNFGNGSFRDSERKLIANNSSGHDWSNTTAKFSLDKKKLRGEFVLKDGPWLQAETLVKDSFRCKTNN